MLIVQKFHSIHEIDSEFIPNIELLLQEDVPGFDVLVQRHDEAPPTDVFTYFLFFGPTQNSPIGFAQLCLRQLPGKELLPWYKKMKFWNKDHEHWKEVIWQIGDGAFGPYVFDSKFSRTGKEKIQSLINEYQAREDIMAQRVLTVKGTQELTVGWPHCKKTAKEVYVLEPLHKAFKTYQDYLESLPPDDRKEIKAAWKELHKGGKIVLGDYPSPLEAPKTLPLPQDKIDQWAAMDSHLLTFEMDLEVLGCILLIKGKNGNFFFEPYPFEPEGRALVSDELYIQYALIKFFEMTEARKCHLLKFGRKLFFQDKADLTFFQAQGLQHKTLMDTFCSRLDALTKPV